ncbi:hypothetical protein [Pseudomonas sp. JAI120]|uniref:hypothetical protein n=1 Tax=Pseudomonas sp. JAI120 TaxID=2723063 RepID=UPI001F11FDEE
MHTLHLSPLARSRLSAQITQNGVFVHTFYGDNGVDGAKAAIIIEQCDSAVSMRVKLGDSINSITLVHQEDTGIRAAHFLEEVANGMPLTAASEVDEYIAAKEGATMTMTMPISELDQRLLSEGIAGWRNANVEIDKAIRSENWRAIESAQQYRSLQANAIALIFHKYAGVTAKQGEHP